MIVFVFTRRRGSTHREVPRWPEVSAEVEVWSYLQLFRRSRLPRATYIFGDFDRLSPWDVELAARLFRILRDGGARVLNDPARVLQRYPLLRRLHAEGRNSFTAWMLETDGLPTRYPVFLRTASSHRGAATDLLHDAQSVQREAERLIASGIPSREILAVEYRAEPLGAIFRKYALHRVGPAMVTSLSVHSRTWMAKYGEHGLASAESYGAELAMIRENRFADALRPVFDIAHTDYGRVDFGIVDGRVEVYEINNNPTMRALEDHPNADRMAADRHWRAAYGKALDALDFSAPGLIPVEDPIFLRQRRYDRWVFRDRYAL